MANKRVPHNRLELNIEYIIGEYIKGRSANDIAREKGVSKGVILGRLKENGISRRQANTYDDITKDDLQKYYIEKKMSTRDIAKIYGCSNTVVADRLRTYGIPVRRNAGDSAFSVEERRKKWGRPGKLHPRWKGGITEVSNVIRNRLAHVTLERFKQDGFRCVECGEGEHNLNAHHVIPFSEIVADIRSENNLDDLSTWERKVELADICEVDERLLDINNLITLCAECHIQLHKDELMTTA